VEGIVVGCRPPIPLGGTRREGNGKREGGGVAEGEGRGGGGLVKGVGAREAAGEGNGEAEEDAADEAEVRSEDLMPARRALLEEHGVPFTIRPEDGTILIGPFELKEPHSKVLTPSGIDPCHETASPALTSTPPPA
jgi:hypothetical protein